MQGGGMEIIMFNYREFLMQGFKNAVGKMADYQIIFNANGFYEKGVLTEDDLSELQELINTKNVSAEETDVTDFEEVTQDETL